MKGKWAAGHQPAQLHVGDRDRFAVSERPVASERRIARCVVKGAAVAERAGLRADHLAAPGAVEPPGVRRARAPLRPPSDPDSRRPRPALRECYFDVDKALSAGKKVLLHGDELGDRVMGVVAGYLSWSGRIAQGPASISAVEHLFERSMGPDGREIVA